MLPTATITATLLAERMPLTAFFAAVARDFHVAEDIFQDVCVKALTRTTAFESTAHLLAWARLLGKNRAIDILRARDGRFVGLSDEVLALLATEWPDRSQTDGLQEALGHCIEQITEHNRHLLRLRYFEQRSCGDVAAIMGRRVETVYQALARLHRTLGECLRGRLTLEASR
jgi:RNA polymerase sigma-70 factor (ECF subfamily)